MTAEKRRAADRERSDERMMNIRKKSIVFSKRIAARKLALWIARHGRKTVSVTDVEATGDLLGAAASSRRITPYAKGRGSRSAEAPLKRRTKNAKAFHDKCENG
jgi:hypothetical protein